MAHRCCCTGSPTPNAAPSCAHSLTVRRLPATAGDAAGEGSTCSGAAVTVVNIELPDAGPSRRVSGASIASGRSHRARGSSDRRPTSEETVARLHERLALAETTFNGIRACSMRDDEVAEVVVRGGAWWLIRAATPASPGIVTPDLRDAAERRPRTRCWIRRRHVPGVPTPVARRRPVLTRIRRGADRRAGARLLLCVSVPSRRSMTRRSGMALLCLQPIVNGVRALAAVARRPRLAPRRAVRARRPG